MDIQVPPLAPFTPSSSALTNAFPAGGILDRRRTPSNVLACLELDRLSAGRPLLHRARHLADGLASASSVYTTNVPGHHGCVNTLSFSNLGEEFLVTGGDDERILVWKIAELCAGRQKPNIMPVTHKSNVFTAVFSCDNTYIYSGGNDCEVIKHDVASGHLVRRYLHSGSVNCVCAHPFSPDIILASDDTLVHIIDTRIPNITSDMVLVEDLHGYQSVTFNPVEPRLVALGGTENGTRLFDTRERSNVLRYRVTRLGLTQEEVVSIAFNSTGTQLFVMMRKLPPCLYNIWERDAKFSFVDDTGCYRNTVTMKSGCFLGQQDEFVVSGSDDFRVYIWKIPDGSASTLFCPLEVLPHLVLPGHRSIVNQVRYSPVHRLMCSSGVEKVIKLWSHLPVTGIHTDTVERSGAPPSRKMHSLRRLLLSEGIGDEGLDPLDEDTHTLALFDSLIDRDDWGSCASSSSSSSSSSLHSGYIIASSASSETLSSDSDADDLWPLGRGWWPSLDAGDPWCLPSRGSSTPSSLSPANTSSLEPPWSDVDEREWWGEEEEEEEGEEEGGRKRLVSEGIVGGKEEGEKRSRKRKEALGGKSAEDQLVPTPSLLESSTSQSSKSQGGIDCPSRLPMTTGESSTSAASTQIATTSREDAQGSLEASTGSRTTSSSHHRSSRTKKRTYSREYFLKRIPPSRFYGSSSVGQNPQANGEGGRAVSETGTGLHLRGHRSPEGEEGDEGLAAGVGGREQLDRNGTGSELDKPVSEVDGGEKDGEPSGEES